MGGEWLLMRVSDFLAEVRDDLNDVAALKDALARLEQGKARSDDLPSSRKAPFVGGCPRVDACLDMERKLQAMKRATSRKLRVVDALLYGAGGRGGIAKLCGRTEADILHARYVGRMTWPQIGAELAMPESRAPAQWAKRRAERALRLADSMDPRVLAGARP